MKCPRCQQENPPQAKFCLECATPLARQCANCGMQLPAGAKFCFECATPVGAPGSPPRFASPETYTPKHLAERIINSKAALEGERKQVTVLFADLKGSMELLADRDPEEARKILDPVLERMMEAVHHYEGTVNQVMGDGIMALFGAPVAHEDHAVRACYAALRVQRRVNIYADETQRGGGTPVQIRVGLNSGEVVVRAIGNDLHMDYSAVGQTTHLAARMEQMAKPGSTLITGETLKLAEGYVQVKPLGTVPVKGLEAPTPVYELTGSVPARSRLQASAAPGFTRFVGRERELEQLAQSLGRAAAGRGQVVAIMGEAGVGKSRLAWELARSPRTQGWLVLESGGASYGKTTPYLPVIELLKGYCRIQERDDPRAIRERVAGKFLTLDRALEPLLTPVLALLDIPIEDAAWDALDPRQRRQQTLEAVRRLFLRESQVQPLLLLLEDLHWIDAETQAFLDALVESLPTARVLLLVNYRPDYQHGWVSKTYYLQLRLDPLAPASAEELLFALLGEDRTLEPLKRALIARTEGNPFFLEESVQTLVETGVLVGSRGAYRMARVPQQWQIPPTAQAMLAARIDRLGPEDKRLLQTAAVIGKDVPFALLRGIADEPEDSLRRALAHLRAAEFLYETSLFPDLEYTFKHALTHEVTYGGLLQERRRELHARIVDAIETLHRDRIGEQIERLAHHALRGELREKAVHYLRQAGLKAAARSAMQDATVWFDQALSVIETLPERDLSLEQAVDIRLDLRRTLTILGEPRRALERLREAATRAARLNDDRRRGRVLAVASLTHAFLGELDQAYACLTQALAIAAELGDRELHVIATSHLQQAHYYRGEYRQVVEIATEDLAAMPANELDQYLVGSDTPASIFDRSLLAVSLAQLGRFTEAAQHEAVAMRFAESTERAFPIVQAQFAANTVQSLKGDWRRAQTLIEHWIARLLAGGVVLQLGYAVATSAWVLAQLGERDEALKRLVEGKEHLARQTARGFVGQRGWVCHALGRASLLLERLDEAQSLADLVLTSSRSHYGFLAYALHLLGDVATHPDRLDAERGEAHYRESLALAEPRGMRPLVAHCHLGLGKLYRRTDKGEQAQEHLATATTMYREMGMTYWLEQAEAEVKGQG